MKVIEALTGPEKHGLVRLNEGNNGFCTPAAYTWLSPNMWNDLLTCLANDIIDDSDVKAARRQIYESVTLPF